MVESTQSGKSKYFLYLLLGAIALLVALNFKTISAFFGDFEHNMLELLKSYGYIILFCWSILEGEMGLIMAGILSHTGDMFWPMAVFVAGLGGFAGDQIYFYIGRFNKGFIQRKLYNQRRKFAIAHLLLKKYGWPIIFVQRYMYGMRTVIPMSIGITKYSARKFAFINLISAFIWAAVTILPAYLLGEEILQLLAAAKRHWYVAIPIAGAFVISIYILFNRLEKQLLEKRNERRNKQPRP